jgi:hypothetical protein
VPSSWGLSPLGLLRPTRREGPAALVKFLGSFPSGIYSLAVRKTQPAEPASAAPVISAHMENGIIIGAAVLCIITLVLLLTLKR